MIATLLAVIHEGLGVRGHCTLHRSIVPVGLRNHPRGVDVPGGEGETTLSVGVDGVLIRLDMFIPVPGTRTNLVDLLDLRPDHDHHVTVLHGNLENLVVAGLASLPVGGKEELRVALGPEAHGGRGAQREGSDDRAKLAFAIVVVLACYVSARKWKLGRRTHVDLVFLHVPKRQELIEVVGVGHESIRADLLRIQGANEGIRVCDGNLLRPDQALESTENNVGCLSKALGLDRNAKLVLGALVLLAQ